MTGKTAPLRFALSPPVIRSVLRQDMERTMKIPRYTAVLARLQWARVAIVMSVSLVCGVCPVSVAAAADGSGSGTLLSLQIEAVSRRYPQGKPVSVRAYLKNETHKSGRQQEIEVEDLLSCYSDFYSNVIPHMVRERGLDIADGGAADMVNPPRPRPPLRMLLPGDVIVKYIHLDRFIDIDPRTGKASRQPVFSAPPGRYEIWFDCWIRTGAGRRVRLTSNKIWVEIAPVSIETEPAK